MLPSSDCVADSMVRNYFEISVSKKYGKLEKNVFSIVLTRTYPGVNTLNGDEVCVSCLRFSFAV